MVVEALAVIRGADPDAAAELNTRLLGLDFHRHGRTCSDNAPKSQCPYPLS